MVEIKNRVLLRVKRKESAEVARRLHDEDKGL